MIKKEQFKIATAIGLIAIVLIIGGFFQLLGWI